MPKWGDLPWEGGEMGYSYDLRGRLCCDFCGQSGGVRKIKCPFGWCPAAATCPSCGIEHREGFSKAYHRKHGCEANHLEFERREAEKRRLLEEGKFLRTSALQHAGKGIKVIFRNLQGTARAYFMSRKAYHAIPYLVSATPDDYRSHGRLRKAKSLNIYDPY